MNTVAHSPQKVDMVKKWLALLPDVPEVDEYGRPWALCKTRGMTPAQQRYFAAIRERETGAPSAQLAQGQAEKQEPMIFRNGVLTDTHLYICLETGKLARRAITTPTNIGEIFQLALTYHLAAIWIFPGTQLSAQAGEAFNVAPEWVIGDRGATYNERRKKRTTTRYIGGYKREDMRTQGENGDKVYVGYAQHNSTWGLAQIATPGLLIYTLAYIEDVLKFPALWSPAAGGRRVITLSNKNAERKEWIRPVDMRKYPACCAENVRDLAWKRPLTPDEAGLQWVLAYDKNSEYGSACTGARLGSGEPIEVHNPTFTPDKPAIGVWHCKISGTSIFDGVSLPHPTEGKTEGYFWSYTVKLLLELGYTVEIDHAWVWQESHTILRPFAEQLWRSRTALQDTNRYTVEQARKEARDIVKAMINHCIGSLNSRDYLKEGANKWFRPDWRELIRDNGKYQMFRRILKNYEEGYQLLGAHVDCLLYAASTPDHAQAIPDDEGKWLDRPGMGGYKRKYSVDIPIEVARDHFNNPATTMEQINSMLDTYCYEQEQVHNGR